MIKIGTKLQKNFQVCKKNCNFAHKLRYMELIFASNNLHKLEEVRKILPQDIHVLSLNDIGFHHEIEETGTTLSENSRIKAEAVHEWLLHHPEVEWDGIFADDTGLEISALNGAPGVYTARWAGEDCVAANNRAKALAELQGETNREARFRTVVTLIRGNKTEQVDGIVDGEIATEERGEGGFGYDPVFIPAGYDKTFAQLPAETKNNISHRARAMEALRRILVIVAVFVGILPTWAGTWKSYFAYTSVSQIAETGDKVFAISDGSLFSVDKISEEIETYDNTSGLHGVDIRCIFTDSTTGKMVLMYQDGKMDILGPNGKFIYSSDLYNKQMIESKRINNATVENGVVYMSMPFGILVYDLRKEEMTDTYYIGDAAANVNVLDIVLRQDSIFAISDTLTYVASRQADLRNYVNWHSELRSNRIAPDPDKGKVCVDQWGSVWRAAGSDGIQCTRLVGGTTNYIPNGPLSNIPYYLHCTENRLYMLSGGRWAVEYARTGNVMMLENGTWHNITPETICQQTGAWLVRDMVSVAEDPNDPAHFFVACYGCGLVEFRNGQAIRQYFADSTNTLESAAPSYPRYYTRCSSLAYDKWGNLLILLSGTYTYMVSALLPNNTWNYVNYKAGANNLFSDTSESLTIDNRNDNCCWWITCRGPGVGVVFSNNHGTPFDLSDDETIRRESWVDQDNQTVNVEFLYNLFQARNGDVWVGTSTGPIIIPDSVNPLLSNRCYRLRIPCDEGYLMEGERINGFTQDQDGNIWVATNTNGVYVLSEDGQHLINHYTGDNSGLLSNCILSLASHPSRDLIYIGTGSGLVSYTSEEPPTRLGEEVESEDEGLIGNWRLYPSFSTVADVVCSPTEVYGLANGHLFSVNRNTREIKTYDKTDGLSGSTISHFQYDNATRQLALYYANGMLDVILDNKLYPMQDLYLKASDIDIAANQLYVGDGHLYLAMNFGIVDVNLQKREVANTYYIGHNASNVQVLSITSSQDSLFALSKDTLYSVSKSSNMVDFTQWKRRRLDGLKNPSNLMFYRGDLYLFADSMLLRSEAGTWEKIGTQLNNASCRNDVLLAYSNVKGIVTLDEKDNLVTVVPRMAYIADYSQGDYWMVSAEHNLERYRDGNIETFSCNSPANDYGYKLQYIGNRLMVASGGRWAVDFQRDGTIKYLQKGLWGKILRQYMTEQTGVLIRDIMGFAVDPRDASHFFAACYGNGLLEFRDNLLVNRYSEKNSTITSSAKDYPDYYARVDAPIFDSENNLYVLNMGTQGYTINIMDVNGKWTGVNLYNPTRQRITLETACSDMLIDSRNPNWKWLAAAREGTGVILWDDNGTPCNSSDDKSLLRNVFVDQKEKEVSIQSIYCMVQDRDGVIWVGTNAGPVLIDHTNFFTSNACKRVIIRRNDGTDLADYLLADEQINAIAVDGGNRKWIGTAKSGLYLMSADGQETIHHFTAKNSNLPSSEILSIAINPETGDVYVGTAAGIASYRSDASEPKEDMSGVYAYPNPVRPDYVGQISITGLMDNSWVNIVDAGGNIVCKTRSYGGTATWDGCDQRGNRVASGVYSALCNAGDGSGHGVVKILIMNR